VIVAISIPYQPLRLPLLHVYRGQWHAEDTHLDVHLELRTSPGRSVEGGDGDGQGARSMNRLPLPHDRLHLVFVVHLVTINVSDNVRIHRITLMVGAGVGVSTPHGVNMVQVPRPISHAPGSFGTEIGSGTILLKVLVLNSVKEGGVGLLGKDQLLTRGVAGQSRR
jgi:hypothetical protein